MPELPEVQTIVNGLNERVAGAAVVGVWSDWKKMVVEPRSWEEFERLLLGLEKREKEDLKNSKFSAQGGSASGGKIPASPNSSQGGLASIPSRSGQSSNKKKGRTIEKVKRIGKFIVFELEGGMDLIVHLRMTGHFLVIDENKRKNKSDPIHEKVNNYIHFVLKLDGGREVALSDLRKFGKIYLVESHKVYKVKSPLEIGIDSLDKDFTLDKFLDILKNKKGNIKQALMDQGLIAGIGNIYSSEILWEAGVSPLRKAESLSESELEAVYKAIGKVLRHAVKMRGDSESDYRDVDGRKGGYQNVQKVYQREKEKCYRCGGIIKRVKIGQRSGFWCPRCQK